MCRIAKDSGPVDDSTEHAIFSWSPWPSMNSLIHSEAFQGRSISRGKIVRTESLVHKICNQTCKQIHNIGIMKYFPEARGVQTSQELFSKAIGNISLLQVPFRNIILQTPRNKSNPKETPNLHISKHSYYT